MSGRVEGKVALITGAARGQGRSHAVRLAEEGADIIATDLCGSVGSIERFYPGTTPEDLAETAAQVQAIGRRIVATQADVRDYGQLQDAVRTGLAELGRIDIVCANAGIFSFGDQTHLVSEQDWQDVIDVNQTGVWHTCKAVIPHLIEQGTGGSIIISSSTAGIKGTPNVAPYTASKHAIVGLMRTLALELAPHSIRVNTVHPTGVSTPMLLNEPVFKLFLPNVEHPTQEQAVEAFRPTNAIPVPWVESIDVSHAVVYLASDESRYVTGLELKIDAGYSIR